jgi:hypothetical protein
VPLSALTFGVLSGVGGALLPSPLALHLVARDEQQSPSAAPLDGLGSALGRSTTSVAAGLLISPLFYPYPTGIPLLRSVTLAALYMSFGTWLALREILAQPSAPWSQPHGLVRAVHWTLVAGIGVWTGIATEGLRSGVLFGSGVWLGIAQWHLALFALRGPIRVWGTERCCRALALATAALLVTAGACVGLQALQA